MYKFILLSLFLLHIVPALYAQYDQIIEKNKGYFVAPVDIPMYLSGNYGELRSTHFHGGIDIKTQGATGKNVYATANGYVSRIKIRHGGYGKALYIDHPNGLTTVYGHLDGFSEKIEAVTKGIQYKTSRTRSISTCCQVNCPLPRERSLHCRAIQAAVEAHTCTSRFGPP